MSFYIVCEECPFETKSSNDIRELQHLLTDLEGAYVSDGDGGCLTICPECKEDSLNLTD